MDRYAFYWYNAGMRDFDIWLNQLSTEPLPGGVAAAAVAAAMGAGLVAKATRITLQRQRMDGSDHTAMETMLDLARREQNRLLDLAEDDEQAYRAVLTARSMPTASPTTSMAWFEATTVPLLLAETCHSLLDESCWLVDVCWPAVLPDMQIGRWLLTTGLRAGMSAAESNIRSCSDAVQIESLRQRLAALM